MHSCSSDAYSSAIMTWVGEGEGEGEEGGGSGKGGEKAGSRRPVPYTPRVDSQRRCYVREPRSAANTQIHLQLFAINSQISSN